ncbi:hypothetical protein ACHQM5_013939 [Ranunculus cassubicifolius]
MSETEKSTASSSSSSRVIKLLCPSISKKNIVELTVWDDQRLDLGLISHTFGLDPASVKLNKHLISKGADFISTSITWRSLLSYFASRGFPTGLDQHHPLIVQGKLCKSGTKRIHISSNGEGDQSSRFSCLKRKPTLTLEQDINNLLKKQKTTPAEKCFVVTPISSTAQNWAP